jgi:hypothetical protein
MLAVKLVKDMRMPANRGDKSKWFTLKPEYIPPFKPTPKVNIATVSAGLQPVYEAHTRAMAGPKWPEIWTKIN